jgi:hypothetical protein
MTRQDEVSPKPTHRSSNISENILVRGKRKSARNQKLNFSTFGGHFNDPSTTFKNENGEAVSLESGELKIQILKVDVGDIVLTESKDLQCSLLDFFDNQIEFNLISGHFKENEKVFVRLAFVYEGMNVKISSKGVIKNLLFDQEIGKDQISINLDNVDEEEVKSFYSLYTKRKEAIDSFLMMAKGT